MRQVVLAQRNQDPVIAAREVEPFAGGFVVLDSSFQRLRRAVLDQVGQVLDELGGAFAAEIVGLRERENFLELIEDQERNERVAGRVAQDVVAMVEELPQRFTLRRDADLRPLTGLLRRAEDRGLDLLGGRRGFARIVDAHVHRAVAHRSEPRDDAGAQDRGLAEPGLPEQQCQGLALHAPRELSDFVLATVEVRARFFAERVEPEPRVLRVDRRLRHRAPGGGPRVVLRPRGLIRRGRLAQGLRRQG